MPCGRKCATGSSLSAPRGLSATCLATDQVLYSVAAGAAETRLLVRALRAQHDLLAARIAELKRADGSAEFAASAHALVGLLEVCHHVEQEVLIPALAVLPGVDLSGLIEDVDTLLSGGALKTPEVVDVREIPHGRRHPGIFGVYARLAPGESFVLVNSHDPKPLRREFQATYPGRFGWDYLEAGPERWRVRIGGSRWTREGGTAGRRPVGIARVEPCHDHAGRGRRRRPLTDAACACRATATGRDEVGRSHPCRSVDDPAMLGIGGRTPAKRTRVRSRRHHRPIRPGVSGTSRASLALE